MSAFVEIGEELNNRGSGGTYSMPQSAQANVLLKAKRRQARLSQVGWW